MLNDLKCLLLWAELFDAFFLFKSGGFVASFYVEEMFEFKDVSHQKLFQSFWHIWNQELYSHLNRDNYVFNEKNIPKDVLFLYFEPFSKDSLVWACSSKQKQTVANNVCNDNQFSVLGPYLGWCVNNRSFSAANVANNVALDDLVQNEITKAHYSCKRTNTSIKDA